MYTLQQLSHAETEILIAAPERGESMSRFIELAQAKFTVELSEDPLFAEIIAEKVEPVIPTFTATNG